MRKIVVLVLGLALATVALGAPPRITFNRVVPAAHDLGAAEEVAILYALGDNPRLGELVETFVDRVNESNVLRLRDATFGARKLTIVGENPEPAVVEKIRRAEPADVYLGIKEFTCDARERTGEGTTLDSTGDKVKRRHVFLDAICTARVDVMNPELRRTSSFAIKGEGTSPRVETISNEERDIAFRQATKYAAIDAAEHITPRRVRESIPLDETAPAFEEGMLMIAASRHEEAQTIWMTALRKNDKSAALHYNLAAVAEALGDLAEAEKHYAAARKLEPEQPRYRDEMRSFLRRNARMK